MPLGCFTDYCALRHESLNAVLLLCPRMLMLQFLCISMTFKLFGSQTSWVFLLYSTFFLMLGIKQCTPYLVTCHCGFKTIICVFSKLLKVLKNSLKALTFVLLHQTSWHPA